jgi:hypothetical protein
MLISSVAYRHAIPVFAGDTDYAMYARHLPLRLHQPRPGGEVGHQTMVAHIDD